MSMTVSGVAGATMPSMMSGASPPMAPPQQKMSNLYSLIDTTNAGSISQSQFMQAFQTKNPPAAFKAAGADSVWGQLDPSGSGQVSQQDFVNGMKSLMVQLRQSFPQGQTGRTQTITDATQGLNALGSQPRNLIA